MNEFYQSTICHVCKKITPILKRCSQCKLYAYCSKEHQKNHWPQHKQFCNMIYSLLIKNGKKRSHVFDIPGIANLTFEEWKQMKVDLKILWEYLLNRKLTAGEDQAWMFPRVCEICRHSKQDILIDCPICYSVSYCCIEHQTAHFHIHKKFCQQLKLCYEINIYIFTNKTFIKPLPKIHVDCEILPENTDIFVKNCTMPTEVRDFVDILTSDIVSPFLTIVYALQTCNLLKNRVCCKNSLVIHIIGASIYEMSLPLPTICEFFFHWISNLTNITLILIGPEVRVSDSFNEQLCHDCNNKTYSLVFERCCYHDYVDSASFVSADLVSAFNCGLHEFEEAGASGDSWTKSIDLLAGTTPLLLTAYTPEEAVRDLQRLQKTNRKLDVVVQCEQNPYRGNRPYRDWETCDSPLFYQNNYVTVVRTLMK